MESDWGQMLLLRARGGVGSARGPRSDEMLSLHCASLQRSQKSVGCPDPRHVESVRSRAPRALALDVSVTGPAASSGLSETLSDRCRQHRASEDYSQSLCFLDVRTKSWRPIRMKRIPEKVLYPLEHRSVVICGRMVKMKVSFGGLVPFIACWSYLCQECEYTDKTAHIYIHTAVWLNLSSAVRCLFSVNSLFQNRKAAVVCVSVCVSVLCDVLSNNPVLTLHLTWASSLNNRKLIFLFLNYPTFSDQ